MRLHLIPIAIVTLLIAPQAASASKFTVTPTEVNLSTSATSALVTLRNNSKSPLRFEVTLVSWSEDEHGQMALKPSSDVQFFPKLIELAAGASRNIRIGIKAGTARDTKIGIPVCVRPAKPARTAAIDGVSVENAKVLVRVRNTGNLHVSVDTIKGTGTGGSGATFTKEGAGWYVLPGAMRIFEIPMTATECKSTTHVAVEVIGHKKSL